LETAEGLAARSRLATLNDPASTVRTKATNRLFLEDRCHSGLPGKKEANEA